MAALPYTNLQMKDLSTFFEKVLKTDKFQYYVQNRMRRNPRKANKYHQQQHELSKKLGTANQNNHQFRADLAKVQLAEMHTRVTMMGIRAMTWYFHKTMRHAL